MKNEPAGYGFGNQAKISGNPKSSDSTGERKEALIKGMVPKAKENATGENKPFNGGRHSGICYTHSRSNYR